jgi:purine-cytosine permease-like protein
MEKKQLLNGLNLTLLQISSFASIPAVMLGFMLAREYGGVSAIMSIIIGNILLFILAVPLGIKSTINRKTTAEEVEVVLGKFGTKISSLGLSVMLIGWFAVNLRILVQALSNILCKDCFLNEITITLGVGILIILLVINGINALKFFSKLAVPLFIITMGNALISSFNNSIIPTIEINNNILQIKAILLIIAAPFGMIFDLPTYYRFSKSKKDSVLSIAIVFIIALSVVEILGVIIASLNQNQENIINVLTLNQSLLFLVVNTLFILITGIAVNNGNLYVSSINSGAFLSKVSLEKRIILFGIIGTGLSFFDVLANFDKLLNGIMIIISSLMALIFLSALNAKKQFNNSKALYAVLISSLLGFLSFFGLIHIVECSYLESAVLTIIIYSILEKVKIRGVKNA